MGNRRVKLPDKAEHGRLWGAMSVRERRELLKLVRRGEPAGDRKRARIGVGVARQQQRYWKWAWLVGPAIALLLSRGDLVELLVSLALGTAVMGVLSIRNFRRAVASEHANLELLGLTPD